MTYQEKFDELQTQFSAKFDAFEKFQKKLSLGNDQSDQFLIVKSEFEKASSEFQAFLNMFKDSNASPGDEFGSVGERCT
jgi:hypothetical protein